MIPDDESLEFLIEHLKYMIQEQPDRKIEKISDLTDILSDFMSTFLVVVDALISSSQRRFGSIDQKLSEFEDLLLSSSIKGLSELSELSQVTEKKVIKEAKQLSRKVTQKKDKIPPKPSTKIVTPPPPKPVQETKQLPTSESTEEILKTSVEISENMEVEDLAAFAFEQREKSDTPRFQPTNSQLGGISLKMELMQELKKKFSSDKEKKNETKRI